MCDFAASLKLIKVTNPVLSIAVLFDSLDKAWPARTARFALALAGTVGASGTPHRRAVFVRLWPHNEIATKTRPLLVKRRKPRMDDKDRDVRTNIPSQNDENAKKRFY